MRYIIHGATGAQGKPLFTKLLNTGADVIAAVRNPITTQGSPAIAVDLSSTDSLINAYKDADGVFVHLPLGPEPVRHSYAQNISEAISIAKPKRVLISTSGWDMNIPGDESALPTLVKKVQATGTSLAILAPCLYLENLLLPVVVNTLREESILHYPLRNDYAVSWCSHLDVADVAVLLFESPSVTGIVGIGQLPPITGEDLAGAFSKHLGREVTFKSLQPEEFGRMLIPLFGEHAAADVAAVYKAKAQTSEAAIDKNTSAQYLLGITPRTVGKWLADIAF